MMQRISEIDWTGLDHKRRKRENSMMALDKVPVGSLSTMLVEADTIQPSSEEAKELHDLMLHITDKRVKQIDGEDVKQMRDTEVGFGFERLTAS